MRILALGCTHGKLPKNFSKLARNSDVIVHCGDIPGATLNQAQIKYRTVVNYAKWWDSLSKQAQKKIVARMDKEYEFIVKNMALTNKLKIILRGNTYRDKKEGGELFTNKLFKKFNVRYSYVGSKCIHNYDFIWLEFHYEKYNVRKEPGRSDKYIIDFFKLKLLKKKFPKLLAKSKNAIIVSHAPPYRCLDALAGKHVPKKLRGKHVGSKLLRQAIEKYKPLLVICSHIHEARGVAKIGKTTVVNVGSFGQYALINVEGDKVKVNLR